MKRNMHSSWRFLTILGFSLAVLSCSSETRELDTDGDGLSDVQESMFGTHPQLADTDGDTLLDSEDAEPCKALELRLNPQVMASASTQTLATAIVQVTVVDELGRLRQDISVGVETDFGQITPMALVGLGLYEVTLSSTVSGFANVTFKTLDSWGNPDGRAQQVIQISLKVATSGHENPGDQPSDNPDVPNPDVPNDNPEQPNDVLIDENHVVLEQPGVNPGRYQKAGAMNGELWVMAIDGDCLDWTGETLKSYANAYVQVDLSDGTKLTGQTNAQGWVHFVDARLKGPVTVTVGAKGARYVSWVDVDARVISAGIHQRDIIRSEAATKAGVVTGVVRGFWGETGLPSLPKENTNVFETINIAIVQLGIRNTPLSSMNTGAILLPPNAESATAEFFEIPPNLVLSNLSKPENSRFTIDLVKPGKYVVFALAGAGGNIMAASQNPYELRFTPMALGFKEIEIKAGQTIDIDLDLSVDLRTSDNDFGELYFGNLPNDPKSGKPLPMGLVLPMFNTGKGYVFLDVNSAYNLGSFQNPVVTIYPQAVHQTLAALGLSVHPMVVGLAGRKAVNGFDLPGISTLIMHPERDNHGSVSTQDMNQSGQWPNLPTFVWPEPPQSSSIDAVGGRLNPTRRIAWQGPSDVDMTVLRLNYMTPPIHNKLLNSDIGASQAHLLWEVFVPGAKSDIVLPELETSAPDYPVLVNYAPTDANDAYQYGSHTIEIEISPYYMGPKSFNFNVDFLMDDVNMNAWGVSQDSYLVDVTP